jgi:hypothetical protein
MEVAAPPKRGQIVRVRTRQHLVEDVIPSPTPGEDTVVRLSCLDDDAQGEPLDVLWERELDAEILRGSSLMHVADRGFDQPDVFSAYLHTLRWSCVTATNPKLLPRLTRRAATPRASSSTFPTPTSPRSCRSAVPSTRSPASSTTSATPSWKRRSRSWSAPADAAGSTRRRSWSGCSTR